MYIYAFFILSALPFPVGGGEEKDIEKKKGWEGCEVVGIKKKGDWSLGICGCLFFVI